MRENIKQNNKSLNNIARLLCFLNALLMTATFAFIWYKYYSTRIYLEPFYQNGNYFIILVFGGLYIIFGRIYNGFKIEFSRTAEIIYSQAIAEIVTNIIMYVIIVLLYRGIANPIPLIGTLVIEIVISIIWSAIVHRIYFSRNVPSPTLIVYGRVTDMESIINHYMLNNIFSIKGNINIAEHTVGDIIQRISGRKHKIDVVFLCGLNGEFHEKQGELIKYCVENSIRVYINPEIEDTLICGAKASFLCNLPLIKIDNDNHTIEYRIIKRTFDIIISFFGLIVLLPIMLLISLAIKLEDRGHVFYKQERMTIYGRKFNIIKFRSMIENAESDGVARLSSGKFDERVTKVGRFIRKVRLDEIPQLINVLKGDMSIVGPRPEREEVAKVYKETLPEFDLRLQVKAGLTGLAQVYGKYNTTPYDKLQFDLMYISNASIIEDIRIMFATVKILFIGDSTEGISKGYTTAKK